jgi:hypothetical protein
VFYPFLPSLSKLSKGLRFAATRFARRQNGNIPTCPAPNLLFASVLLKCAPPLPIPNREVKAFGPDDTRCFGDWESRVRWHTKDLGRGHGSKSHRTIPNEARLECAIPYFRESSSLLIQDINSGGAGSSPTSRSLLSRKLRDIVCR